MIADRQTHIRTDIHAHHDTPLIGGGVKNLAKTVRLAGDMLADRQTDTQRDMLIIILPCRERRNNATTTPI